MVTAESIEAAKARQEATDLAPCTDPVLLRRVAVLIAVWRQRQQERGRDG
jgi:hypothetical protein